MAANNKRLACLVELMEELMEIKKNHWKDTEAIEKVQEIVNKSTKLIKDSNSTNEIVLDARILHTSSQIISSNVKSFDTNLTSFNEEEYKKGILSYLKGNSNGKSAEKSWKCLAPFTYHLYHKSDPPIYMLGSLSFDPEPVKERAKIEKLKKVSGSKTMLETDLEGSPETDEIKDTIYEHILKSLVCSYKSNDKKPLNLIEFIINPDSYWNSVQNIFYFSFLVRDGRVNLFVDDEGLPVVEPVLNPQPSGGEDTDHREKSKQFIFTLTVKQWKECIQKFNITSPKITPIQEY